MFNAPLGLAKIDTIIGELDLAPGATLLDIGCGTGEFLIRAADCYGARGVGIDIDETVLASARELAAKQLPEGKVTFMAGDAATATIDAAPFDAVFCIGASHALGGFRQAVRRMKELTKPDGLILIGDVYWKCDPDPAYLEILGGQHEHRDHGTTAALGEQEGLLLLYACRSSDDEWDHFEGKFARRGLLKHLGSEGDPERAGHIAAVRDWYRAYLRWGIGTMGFGIYLYRNHDLADSSNHR